MKTSLILPVLIVFISVLSFLPHDAHATSTDVKDQASCQATPLSGTWTGANSTCTISNFVIGYSDILTVDNSVYPNIALTIDGTVTIEDSCSKVGCTAGTLSNNGQLVISRSGSITSDASIINAGTLDNLGAINSDARSYISNTGTINNIAGGILNCNYCVGIGNSGTINNNAGGTFDVSSFSNFAIFNNYGTFNQNGGDYYNEAGGTINNYGTMSSGYFYNYNIINNKSTGVINNTGTYVNSGGNILNSGTINNNSGATLTNSGVINNLCVGIINNSGTITGNPPINPCNSDSTVLTLTPNPSETGQQVTFTATVSPSAATGTITFLNGTTTLGTGTLSGGVATFSTSSFNAGSYSITAQYSGDANYLPGTSNTLTQTVNKGSTNLTVITSLTPSVFNQTVTFTATVSAIGPASGTPTGTMTFTVDGVTQPPTTIGFGNAFLVTSTLSVGTHTISAQYSGDANFLPSASNTLTQTVNKANTKTTVTSSANPSIFGHKVTFTVKVSAKSPSTGTPTGTVTFSIDGTPQTPIALSSGKASLSTTTLSVGNHTISAQYSGDANYNPSTSSTLTVKVLRATSTTLSPSVVSVAPGTSQIYTVTVSDTSPGTKTTPSGTVSWRANVSGGSFSSGTCTLVPISSSQSSCQVTYTSPTTAGTVTITGTYGGDSTHANSAGKATLTVT